MLGIVSRQREKVATPQLDRIMAVNRKPTLLADNGLDTLPFEELFDRLVRQLHAQHSVTFAGKPGQIKAFTAQRHQHPRLTFGLDDRPELPQPRVDLAQVKANLILRPTLMPKVRLHAHS